ncbi:MAG: GNAT family N-acetyltransferase [Clostridiales bacterium]|nr:GNAT family N-acetyltransferase [Clostridiales bacterium]
MIVETDRLILRPYNFKYINDYYSLMSDHLVWGYSTIIPHENILQSEQKLREIIAQYADGFIGFHALFRKDGNIFIGEAGILSFDDEANKCVIGYNLLPDFWRKGYATEISESLIEYAFAELHIERIEALALKSNTASCKVLEKSGMHLEGVLRHFTKIRGAYEDVCYYSIIRSDYV